MRNEIKSSPERLRENLVQVLELLEIFHHEEALRAAGDPAEPKPSVHNTLPDLRDRLSRMHTADVAQVLESLPLNDRVLAWRQVRDQRGGDILLEVSEAVRASLLAHLSEEELRLAVGQLDADDLTVIADEIPAELLQERLLTLPDDDRRWLQSSMTYAEGTVGSLMSNEMVAVRDHLTLDEVLAYLRSLSELPNHSDKIFVTDKRGILRGVVALQTLLLTGPDRPLSEVMATDVVSFTPDEDGNDAAQAFERYDLISAPVLNERGKLIGRLTVDVMMDFVREESGDDVLNFTGLRGEEDLFSSVWNSARNRWLWLSVNLLTAFVASRVIGMFEGTIAHLVALASLMPIVASIGGNTGNQTTALVIRTLAQGQINVASTFHMLRKEIIVSLLNGAILGLIVSLFAYVLYHDPHLSAVFAGALILNLLVAALVGIAVPLLLEKFGMDPALGSSVLLTATTDSMGFLIFLGLATMFLL